MLVVEDDDELSALLERLLVDEGYEVLLARDGQRALHLGLTRAVDVLVLDRGLPSMDGLEVLQRLRRAGVSVPVLVLSARASAPDRVEGLDAGAEDYLVKPFDVDELLARLRALRRRHTDSADELAVPGGRLRVASRSVTTDAGAEVALSVRECELLEALARRPSQVLSRGQLLRLVFDEAESDAVVDTYVSYCRRKLGRGVITTVRGSGYRLGR